MSNILSLEYENLNSLRAYPLRERCTRADSLGQVVVPDSLIVDASFAVSADPSQRVWVSKIDYAVEQATIYVSTALGEIGHFSLVAQEGQDVILAPNPGFEACFGRLTVRAFSSLASWPVGSYLFTASS